MLLGINQSKNFFQITITTHERISQLLTLENFIIFFKKMKFNGKPLMMRERERERESIGIPLNTNLVSPLGSQLIIIIIIVITYIH